MRDGLQATQTTPSGRAHPYQELNAQIQPVAQEAVQEPKVMEANQKYETVLMETMQEEEPEIAALYNQRNSLSTQYQRLMQAMQ